MDLKRFNESNFHNSKYYKLISFLTIGFDRNMEDTSSSDLKNRNSPPTDLFDNDPEREKFINVQKSSGRWTKEEHQRFIEALKRFGKDWKKVEDFVETRNSAQIRSHAQKFFNRLQREYSQHCEGTKEDPTRPVKSKSKQHQDFGEFCKTIVKTPDPNYSRSSSIPSDHDLKLHFEDSFKENYHNLASRTSFENFFSI